MMPDAGYTSSLIANGAAGYPLVHAFMREPL